MPSHVPAKEQAAADDVEVYANGVAFARAASWLGAASTLTHDAFAAVETRESAREGAARAPRLGLGATRSRAKATWEETANQGATATALRKALARGRREGDGDGKRERDRAAREESESESEDDRSRAVAREKKRKGKIGVYGGGKRAK